ncbi:receptor-type tyrosine-protein phosphatase beta-like [Pseudoliparis swirei]|uniref:receptor-type tyrosine-protein phosphatase beta-like n=1 Tax=Pseudoliparis swirei TaxID=2059687 RepID=UPI0024BEB7C8|nr:receptor-type tyrosine-protein phosphatase beta-like [Pseudoliparis swirei]
MVWEQNVRVVVMVTALRHKDQVMCDKYWPLERGTAHHGDIQVTTVTRQQGPEYSITTINLRQGACPTASRSVSHFHFPCWPDRSVPADVASLVSFTELVRRELEAEPRLGPAVVHCSAGVGRSGAFVAFLWLLQLCVRGVPPDVRAAVEDLRLHRMGMVQNLDQYLLVHQCLLHWLRSGASARPQAQGAALNVTPRGSSGRGGHTGRRHQQQQPPPPQQQQQQPPRPRRQTAPGGRQPILNPGKLLRRLLPHSP